MLHQAARRNVGSAPRLRRSHDRAAGAPPLHTVSAFATTARLVLDQEAVPDKAGETTAIPILLDRLGENDGFKGALVSIDAIATNGTIAAAIRRAGANYLLAVKANQPTLLADVASLFAHTPASLLDTAVDWDKGHSRIEDPGTPDPVLATSSRNHAMPETASAVSAVLGVGVLFNYHAMLTNARALSAFRDRVTQLWRRSLRRRSQRDFSTWERMRKLANDWLPRPRILHPWPSERFAVKHPRWEPSARIGPARFCAGGAQQ